jgi:hypothetical protein
VKDRRNGRPRAENLSAEVQPRLNTTTNIGGLHS